MRKSFRFISPNVVFWCLILIISLFALLLGFWGWVQESELRNHYSGLSLYLAAAHYTLLLFLGEGGLVDPDNYALLIARIVAPIATIGALLRVLIEVFFQNIHLYRITRLVGHSIVIGLEGKG